MPEQQKKRGRHKRSEQPRNAYSFNLLRPHDDIASLMEIVSAANDGKNPNPNTGIMSKRDYDALLVAYDEAMEVDKMPPLLPYIYQPGLIQYGITTNALFAYRGQNGATKPKNWPDNFGDYEKGLRFDQFRQNHESDVRKMVTDADNNVFRIGSYDYIVGTGGENAIPAVMMINPARRGNYLANVLAAKQIGFNGLKQLTHLVARINNRIEKEKLEDGGTIVWAANQNVVWGYLTKEDKQLTCDQIRKLIQKNEKGEVTSDESKGVKFVELSEKIISNPIGQSEWWSLCKRQMSLAVTKDEDGRTMMERFEVRQKRSDNSESTPPANAWRNLTQVQTRSNPSALFCFGFRAVQCGIAMYTCFTDDGKEMVVKFAVGCRLPAGLTETYRQAMRRLSKDQLETPVVKKTKPKKKAKSSQVPDKVVAQEPVSEGKDETQIVASVAKKKSPKKTKTSPTKSKKKASKKSPKPKNVELAAAPVAEPEKEFVSSSVENILDDLERENVEDESSSELTSQEETISNDPVISMSPDELDKLPASSDN